MSRNSHVPYFGFPAFAYALYTYTKLGFLSQPIGQSNWLLSWFFYCNRYESFFRDQHKKPNSPLGSASEKFGRKIDYETLKNCRFMWKTSFFRREEVIWFTLWDSFWQKIAHGFPGILHTLLKISVSLAADDLKRRKKDNKIIWLFIIVLRWVGRLKGWRSDTDDIWAPTPTCHRYKPSYFAVNATERRALLSSSLGTFPSPHIQLPLHYSLSYSKFLSSMTYWTSRVWNSLFFTELLKFKAYSNELDLVQLLTEWGERFDSTFIETL